jgi:hypothetical protein
MRRKIKMKKDDPLSFLERNWPGRLSKDVKCAFNDLKKMLKTGHPPKVKKELSISSCAKGKPLDMLDLIRRTCAALDLLFLSRQITYHISASSELSYVFADADQIQSVLTELLRHAVRRAPHGGRIDISLQEAATRRGPSIEIMIGSVDRAASEMSHAGLMRHFFGEQEGGGHSSIFTCREVVVKQGGQLSVDMPEPKLVVFKIALPTVITPEVSAAEQQTYKYDIIIQNIANLRKRFGIKKTHGLVSQIENYVRSLIRHPVDIVMAVPDKGIITTIYETNRGAAQSVASRISHRLGIEEFRIGKNVVDISFKYNLSLLPQSRGPLK